jgi:hypothetical protein
MPHSPIAIHIRFGGKYCFHLQGIKEHYSKTSAKYQTTRYHIQDNNTRHSHRHENLNSSSQQTLRRHIVST